MDGQQVYTSLITGTAVDAFSCRLDDDVDLMRRAPHMQHIELGPTRVASDDTRVAPSHCVLAVRRRVEQLDAPVWVERVIKLDEQVVDVSAFWLSNIGRLTRWMLQSRPL